MAKVRLGILAVLLAASLGLSGCTGAGCSASNSSSGQEAVCNQDNSFSYSTNAGMTSKTSSYAWSNSKTKAQINWAMNLGMGSATITIEDATGKQVFTKTFSGAGQDSSSTTTSAGQAGEWTVTVKMTGASGQVAFQMNGA